MNFWDAIQALFLVVAVLVGVVIVAGALRNVPRHKKGKFRYTSIGKSSEFEGSGSDSGKASGKI